MDTQAKEGEGEEEGIVRDNRSASSSSFSSYADTFSSRNNTIQMRSVSSSLGNSFYGTVGSSFGGVVVDMNEMDTDDEAEWVGISRYAAGVEEVYGEVITELIFYCIE